ncbi:MAG: 2-amino-4-hydroxy-6-hydroxymethyldihydropteridine diphosphokinase, partial [Planctomycetota bacterium]
MKPVRAYVALGANLGPRRATLRWAVRALDACEGVRVLRASRLMETEAVGGPAGQPDYLNGAVELETTLAPHALLSVLLELESRAGRHRERTEKDAPRTLDLDLLAHGDAVVDDERLTLPHPR